MVKKLIKKLANGLRKIANKIDQDSRLDVFSEDVIIHPSSKILQDRMAFMRYE